MLQETFLCIGDLCTITEMQRTTISGADYKLAIYNIDVYPV